MKPVDPAEYTKILNYSPVAMTAKEAAVILRCSTKLVYKLIRNGKIRQVSIGREYRIPKTELLAFISGNSSAEE